MSHGVPRGDNPADRSAQTRQKELQKIGEYQGLVEQVFSAVAQKEFTNHTLDLTSKLLILNPEYYTIWNDRRRVLLSLFFGRQSKEQTGKSTKHDAAMLNDELQFLLPVMIKFPKCYWIWNHRHWILQQAIILLPSQIAEHMWTQELGLVSKMLGRDSRNFHGWNYRRFVISELRQFTRTSKEDSQGSDSQEVRGNDRPQSETDQSITESEFAYTTKMIKSNLSNFSAWHNRSTLIPRLLDERQASNDERKKLFDEELAFIESAVFTDPYDQSLWYYHQFLMTEVCRIDGLSFVKFSNADRGRYLERQIEAIRELLDDTDDCKWVYQYLLTYSVQYLEIDVGTKLVTTQEMRSWLSQLRALDPMRKMRWDDWEKNLNL